MCQELNNVMTTVVNIINFHVARSALMHRKLQVLLEEMYIQRHSVLQQCVLAEPWKVLTHFVNCIDAIKIFLLEKGQNDPDLVYNKEVVQLVFLTDIIAHRNKLSLHLQGASQTVMDLFETWKEFLAKLTVFFSGY